MTRGAAPPIHRQSFGVVRLTPTTLLIERQTRIVERCAGMPDFSVLASRIDGLTAQA